MLHATTAHRRARLARRQGLSPTHRFADPVAATNGMTALHATEATTPHLSLHARVDGLTVADVEAALYDERSLIKVMGMRRTLFVVEPDLVEAVAGSAGRRVAETIRRRLAKQAAALTDELGPGWIEEASSAIVAVLTGREYTSKELRQVLDHVGGTFVAGEGTKWATETSLMSQLLTITAADGVVVRGRNAGHWRISRPTWTAMATWLGRRVEPTDERSGYAELVRRWLWTFGPGTEDDIVWWLGSTKGAVRRALVDVEALAVALDDDATGYVLPDDTADLERPADLEPWVALLPTVDPTTMGWQDRGFFLDAAYRPRLFDRAGNAGTTVWVDGRVVGCWVQDDDERVRPILLEDVPRAHRPLIDREVARLDEFLDGEHITNVFASPQVRGLPL